MNERIKQLWEQAEEEIKAEYEDESRRNRRLYNEIFLPKFAELIVRECISMADKESERYSNLNQEYCSMAMDNYRELVRKHFGVEE
jgi:hypothetical protein